MCSYIRAFTKPHPVIQIHPATTSILGLPACGTRGPSEHIRQDKIGCLVFHHHCIYHNQLCHLEFEETHILEPCWKEQDHHQSEKLNRDWMRRGVTRHITPHSQLRNPAVIYLPNQGCDHEKLRGNVPFQVASLVVIIIFRVDERLN